MRVDEDANLGRFNLFFQILLLHKYREIDNGTSLAKIYEKNFSIYEFKKEV